ncbi:MAG: MFS transporter [Candidatus Omnitrophica bacterium]|nr:MFS transporter [Candidatus Omnitrophota bacterium]MDD5311203.1 MFS transporter [Candidatus Omnitrophota bacterium]
MNNFFNNTFRTLKLRNFRLFFMGQSISLIGTWMQSVAMSWLVYRMTGSTLLLGIVAFCSQIPTFILSPFAGVFADRYNRHRIVIITQALSMIQAFILAYLTLTGKIQVWEIIALALFLGCVNAVDIPTRQSFLIDMVEKKEMLGNAIALNSAIFNGARLIGPTAAGILVALAGEGICFLINGITFLAVIASLLMMKLTPKEEKGKEMHVLRELKEGVEYAFGSKSIRMILFLLSIISMLGMSYVVLMPVFAADIHHGGPLTLGVLMAAIGVGALIATLYLASRKTPPTLERGIPIAAAIFAAGVILFALSRVLWVSIILLVVTGFGFLATTASSNTLIQTNVDDDKRGRVMSFYVMAFMGMAPIGSLLAGALASKMGAPDALMLGGALCLFATFVFYRLTNPHR